MSFKQKLIDMVACSESISWVEDRTLEQAWNQCHRGDWIIYFLEENKEKEGWPDIKEIQQLIYWYVKRIIKFFPIDEDEFYKFIGVDKSSSYTGKLIDYEERGNIFNDLIMIINGIQFDCSDVIETALDDASFHFTCGITMKFESLINTGNMFDGIYRLMWDEENLLLANYIRNEIKLTKKMLESF